MLLACSLWNKSHGMCFGFGRLEINYLHINVIGSCSVCPGELRQFEFFFMEELLQRLKRKSRKGSSTSSDEDNCPPQDKKSKIDPFDMTLVRAIVTRFTRF